MHDPTTYSRRLFLQQGLMFVSLASTAPLFIQRSAAGMFAAMSPLLSSQPGVPEDRVLVQDGIVAESLRTGLDTLRGEPRLGSAIAWRFPFLRPDSPLLMVACTADRADAAPLVEALEMIARRRPDVDIVWPREAAEANEASGTLHAFNNVHMLELSDYLAWLHLLERAQLVLAGQGSTFPGQLPGKPVLRVCDTPGSDGIACRAAAWGI